VLFGQASLIIKKDQGFDKQRRRLRRTSRGLDPSAGTRNAAVMADKARTRKLKVRSVPRRQLRSLPAATAQCKSVSICDPACTCNRCRINAGEAIAAIVPSSSASRLAHRLAIGLSSINVIGEAYWAIPSRLGHDEVVDAAAKAMIRGCEHVKLRTRASSAALSEAQSHACRRLKDRLSTDDASLISVALLGMTERLADEDLWSKTAHVRKSRPEARKGKAELCC
jgi:hypothetical protein